MDFWSSINGIGVLLASMAAFSLLELAIPLRARGAWNRRHLIPNLALTFITFATNMAMNVPMLFGLIWLERAGWGLFNALDAPPLAETIGGVLALDLAWYATHASMHRFAWMWRFHVIHHSDPAVDVTTAIRQHPGESAIRYLYLAAFAGMVGASPLSFAIYRIWSALHGMFEHANIGLPRQLDAVITIIWTTPNMHKLHHSRERVFTDSNYGNIFSLWDRLFGTFVPAQAHRGEVRYGLDGHDEPSQQTTLGLLGSPFRGAYARLNVQISSEPS